MTVCQRQSAIDFATQDAEKICLEIHEGTANAPLPAALLHNGVIPSAPHKPTVAITIEALELFRIAHNRSLHLSVQAYVKTLCDLHGVGLSSLNVYPPTDLYQFRSNSRSIFQDSFLSPLTSTSGFVQWLTRWSWRHCVMTHLTGSSRTAAQRACTPSKMNHHCCSRCCMLWMVTTLSRGFLTHCSLKTVTMTPLAVPTSYRRVNMSRLIATTSPARMLKVFPIKEPHTTRNLK